MGPAIPGLLRGIAGLYQTGRCLWGRGIRAESPDQLDDTIVEMIKHPGPVIADIAVDKAENCFPMIRRALLITR